MTNQLTDFEKTVITTIHALAQRQELGIITAYLHGKRVCVITAEQKREGGVVGLCPLAVIPHPDTLSKITPEDFINDQSNGRNIAEHINALADSLGIDVLNIEKYKVQEN